MKYDILFFIILMVILFCFYIAAYFAVAVDIKARIRGYKKNAVWSQGIVSGKVVDTLSEKEEAIVALGAIGWPLYYLFLIGSALGRDIYNILIKDNNEDRIASWFV